MWLRLTKAAKAEPREPFDVDVLEAVRGASAAGVIFPLSSTHYQEVTTAIPHWGQRQEVAGTMAAISFCRTLRSPEVLLRHQMLQAMHERFGRPTFRPKRPDVIGIGVHWALLGMQQRLQLGRLKSPGDKLDPLSVPGLQEWLRRGQQAAEVQILAGPRDDELTELRRLGYRPEAHRATLDSRVRWERLYVSLLEKNPISREELRVPVQAREVAHEHLDLLGSLLREYHLDLDRAIGIDPKVPRSGRAQMVAFADAIPTLRIATDLKVELFRDPGRPWKPSTLYDIDAISMAIPYCHLVVPDKQMANFLGRSRAGERNGTEVVTKLDDLPRRLEPLVARARGFAGDDPAGTHSARATAGIRSIPMPGRPTLWFKLCHKNAREVARGLDSER